MTNEAWSRIEEFRARIWSIDFDSDESRERWMRYLSDYLCTMMRAGGPGDPGDEDEEADNVIWFGPGPDDLPGHVEHYRVNKSWALDGFGVSQDPGEPPEHFRRRLKRAMRERGARCFEIQVEVTR